MEKTEKNKREWRGVEIVFMSITVVLNILTWVVLKYVFAISEVSAWGMVLLASTLSLSFFLIASIFIKNTYLYYIGVCIMSLSVWMFGFSMPNLLGMFVFILAGSYARSYFKREKDQRKVPRIWRITRNGTEVFLILLTIVVSLTYFTYLQEGVQNEDDVLIKLQNTGVSLVESMLVWQIPNYQSTMTLDEAVENIAEEGGTKLIDQMIETSTTIDTGEIYENEVTFSDLSEDQQEEIIEDQRQASKQALIDELKRQRDVFLQKYNVQASGDDSIGVVIESFVREFLANIVGSFVFWIAHMMAFGMFFTIFVFTPMVKYLIRICSVVIVKLLKVSDTLKETKKQEEVINLEF